MLLTADIGNSYISFGCFDNDKLLFVSDILTDIHKSVDQYAVEIMQITNLYKISAEFINGAVISSVVPELTEVIKSSLEKISNVNVLVVGPGVKTGLKINIDDPAQLGADTVATSVAVIEKYDLPAVICDFGTATTFGIIDENRSFTGMIIAAGVGTTLEGFTKKTALLPHVSINKPKHIIGTNTVESIQSGLINGTAAMVDGIISRLRSEIKGKINVIGTGKFASKIIPSCKENIEFSEYLVFEGLKKIYEKNIKRGV